MKFLISDTKQLGNKHGKWFYWHDDKCQVMRQRGEVIIYHGYTIGKTLPQHIEEGTLDGADGNFFVVRLGESKLECQVDYFCQNKIFYRHGKQFEVTNQIYLLPLTTEDIDKKYLLARYKMPDTFKQLDNGPTNYHTYVPREGGWPDRSYHSARCETVFKHTLIMQPDHKLVHDGAHRLVRIHNTKKSIHQALTGPRTHMDNTQVQEHIYNCMSEHADVIKQNYSNIFTSVSEGIDGILQDQFFEDSTGIMYNFNPDNSPFHNKWHVLNNMRQQNKNVIIDSMPTDRFDDTVKYMNDPSVAFWDTLPSQWQINKLPVKPDIVLYGQCADQMFMHQPWFYYELVWATVIMNTKDPEEALDNFADLLERNKNSYAVKENIRKPTPTSFYDIWPTDDIKEILKEPEDDWKHSFPAKALPGLYNRDIAHATDLPVSSLYSDRRFFFLIYQMPFKDIFDNAKDVSIEKSILKNKFNIDFHTPHKDAASFSTYNMVQPMYKHTIDYCLKDHINADS